MNSHYSSSNITLNGQTWELEDRPLNIIVQIHTDKVGIPTLQYMASGNITFESNYLWENSVCEPSDHYQWGFSSLLLFVFCLLTALFTLVLSTLHSDAFWNSQIDRFEYDINHYRDAVGLVYELRDENFGDSIQDKPARDLKREVERSDMATRLDAKELPPSRREARRQTETPDE